jgi:hypothetical protein
MDLPNPKYLEIPTKKQVSSQIGLTYQRALGRKLRCWRQCQEAVANLLVNLKTSSCKHQNPIWPPTTQKLFTIKQQLSQDSVHLRKGKILLAADYRGKYSSNIYGTEDRQ